MFDAITEADYRKQIGKGAGGAYFFFGKEDYLKAVAVRQTREALCPDPTFSFFNDITIDALDYTPSGLLDAIAPPPMGAEARLVVVRGLDLVSMRKGELDELCAVLAELPEYDYTTLILDFSADRFDEGMLPRSPSAAYKALAEVAVPVCFAPQSDARLAAWAARHVAHLGAQISPADAAYLISYVGKSMFVLASEIEKLACFVLSQGKTVITAEEIRRVSVPVVEADAFDFSNAILAGQYKNALHTLEVMKFERIEPTLILGELAGILCDMQSVKLLLDAGRSQKEIAKILSKHEYKVGLLCRAVAKIDTKRLSLALALTAAADAELKTGGGYSTIEKLICSL